MIAYRLAGTESATAGAFLALHDNMSNVTGNNVAGLVSSSTHGSVVVLKVLTSTVDIRNAKQFHKEMFERIGSVKQVVLDLEEVDFVDSAGLGTLISTLRQLLAKEGDLRLSSIATRVKVLLEVTRLDRVFKVFPDVLSAVDSFRA